MVNKNETSSKAAILMLFVRFFVFPVLGLIFMFVITLISGNNNSDLSAYQDEYLFFSGIKAGMTGEEADLCAEDSNWLGGEFSEMAKESVGKMYWDEWYDTRDMHLTDGGDFFVNVRFNSLGTVQSIITRIEYDETLGIEKYEERVSHYYDEFYHMYDLWRFEEYTSDSYEFGFLKKKHTYYESSSLIYNINIHKCHLWLDEFNRQGYVLLEITNAYDSPNHPVYSLAFINFIAKDRDQGYYLD